MVKADGPEATRADSDHRVRDLREVSAHAAINDIREWSYDQPYLALPRGHAAGQCTLGWRMDIRLYVAGHLGDVELGGFARGVDWVWTHPG